jgi:hypothetical protein
MYQHGSRKANNEKERKTFEKKKINNKDKKPHD